MFADLGAHTKDFVGCNRILGTAQARNERSGQQPADEIRWINVGLRLVQRRRRWTNVKPTLIQRLVDAGRAKGAVYTESDLTTKKPCSRLNTPRETYTQQTRDVEPVLA